MVPLSVRQQPLQFPEVPRAYANHEIPTWSTWGVTSGVDIQPKPSCSNVYYKSHYTFIVAGLGVKHIDPGDNLRWWSVRIFESNLAINILGHFWRYWVAFRDIESANLSTGMVARNSKPWKSHSIKLVSAHASLWSQKSCLWMSSADPFTARKRYQDFFFFLKNSNYSFDLTNEVCRKRYQDDLG